MRYHTTYWHYQSYRRHYANNWCMRIDKWYDDSTRPAVMLDLTVYGIDDDGKETTDIVQTFEKFGIDDLAEKIERVMTFNGYDFDAADKEDLVTFLIEILSSNRKGKVYK